MLKDIVSQFEDFQILDDGEQQTAKLVLRPEPGRASGRWCVQIEGNDCGHSPGKGRCVVQWFLRRKSAARLAMEALAVTATMGGSMGRGRSRDVASMWTHGERGEAEASKMFNYFEDPGPQDEFDNMTDDQVAEFAEDVAQYALLRLAKFRARSGALSSVSGRNDG